MKVALSEADYSSITQQLSLLIDGIEERKSLVHLCIDRAFDYCRKVLPYQHGSVQETKLEFLPDISWNSFSYFPKDIVNCHLMEGDNKSSELSYVIPYDFLRLPTRYGIPTFYTILYGSYGIYPTPKQKMTVNICFTDLRVSDFVADYNKALMLRSLYEIHKYITQDKENAASALEDFYEESRAIFNRNGYDSWYS